ncbi:MAG: HNH endonuclease [Planctomycetota bacterium]|nr:MAG: HNH endonuclease [Planctomycetota bacterium]
MSATSTSPALSASVLLLNRLYMAVRVISAKRALTLMYRDLAEVVSVEDGQYLSYDFNDWVEVSQAKATFEPELHDWIRTVRFQIAVPKIVRLLGYDKLPKARVKLNRRNLFARDHNRCQYCGRRFPPSELSIDHVVPRSQGGGTSWENVVCACTKCNVRKGGRTPQQARMRLISTPRRPKRSPVLTIKLSDTRYASWKQFLDFACWNVELK